MQGGIQTAGPLVILGRYCGPSAAMEELVPLTMFGNVSLTSRAHPAPSMVPRPCFKI
jgi:hypothetical protein